MTPTARILSGGRLHLQHGPSDLIIWAEGARERAYHAAIQRFETIIAEIVEELAPLRGVLSPLSTPPQGAVAQRMHNACLPLAHVGYVTRMAAVAGSVADEVLTAMRTGADLSRAYVNNGGDIALYLAPGTSFSTAIKSHDSAELGRITVNASDDVGGIATSGRHGRSLSLGIADSVTTLAGSAAEADVAATLIANAVDLPGHSAITRCAANACDENTDLGNLPVVTGCGALRPEDAQQALEAGLDRACAFQSKGRVAAAVLFLQGQSVATKSHLILRAKDQTHAEA